MTAPAPLPLPRPGTRVQGGLLDHVNLSLIRTSEDVARFMTWLGERRAVLGVDTESTGFSPQKDQLRLVQFGDLNHGWAIPWDLWPGLAFEVLNRYEGDLVLHNSPFDARFILRNGGKHLTRWPWERTHDTMTMAHLLYFGANKPKGLKPLSAIHVDPRAAAAQRQLDEGMARNKWTWATVPTEFKPYWIYGAMDPVLTCYIYEKFHPQVKQRFQEVYDLELGTLRVVTNMMLKGARIDRTYCDEKRAELRSWANEARSWLQREYGLNNPGSGEQLANALLRSQVQLESRTPTGKWKLDKEVLESINHPIARYVLAIRKAEKMCAGYFDNFLEVADEHDRVYPTIWPLGARTSRMSVTEPALQTLHHGDPTVRRAFVPTDEEHALLTCDADQIEARLCAHFSRDPGLIAAFNAADDFFCGIASRIFGEKITDKKDARRQLTKNTTYGKIYGAGVAKMAATAGIDYAVMARVVEGFDAQFPGVKMLQREVNARALERRRDEGDAYVLTPLGRRLVSDDNREYSLVNYLIQGHAAEILKRGLLNLDAVGLGDYLVLPVHDEVVLDVPRVEAADVLRLVEETLNDRENYAVPITWSGDVLERSWGQKYER